MIFQISPKLSVARDLSQTYRQTVPSHGIQVFRVRVGVWSPKFSTGVESLTKNKDSASLLYTAVQPRRSVHAACKHSHIRQSVQSQAFLNKNYLLT